MIKDVITNFFFYKLIFINSQYYKVKNLNSCSRQMNFFHYQVRTPNKNHLTKSENEILTLLMGIPPDTISFTSQWVFRLLQLFGSKQQINLFWAFFQRVLLKNSIKSNSNKTNNSEQIDLQQEVLLALANHNQAQYQNNSINDLKQIEKDSKSNRKSLSLGIQDFSENFAINQQDSFHLQQPNNQIVSQKESTNSIDQQMAGPGILPKTLLKQIRTQFYSYRDTQQQFINTAEIARKHCMSEITLGRLLKKWSYQPQFSHYLNKIQQKQKLWQIKTPYFKQIQAWGKKIDEILIKNPYLSCAEIGQKLRLYGKYKIPDDSTLKKIMSQMKYVRKRVGSNEISKNSNENMLIRKKYCEIYLNLLPKNQIAVFFLDQYKFDNEAHPEYGWAKNGQYLPPFVNKSNFYVSLMVLLSQNISFNIKTFINEGNPRPNLAPTLQNLIQQTVNKTKQKKVVLITTCDQMSNTLNQDQIQCKDKELSFTDLAKKQITRYRWNLMILPPKSSQLNPLVNFFKQIREQMRKLQIKCSSLGELEEKLKQICPTLEYFKPNFEQVKNYAIKGMRGIKF